MNNEGIKNFIPSLNKFGFEGRLDRFHLVLRTKKRRTLWRDTFKAIELYCMYSYFFMMEGAIFNNSIFNLKNESHSFVRLRITSKS